MNLTFSKGPVNLFGSAPLRNQAVMNMLILKVAEANVMSVACVWHRTPAHLCLLTFT